MTLKGTLTTGEPDWKLEVDGREWTPAAIAGFVRFGLKYQWGTLDDLLKERELLPLDGALVEVSVGEEMGEGWEMTCGSVFRKQHFFFGVAIPWMWTEMQTGEARQVLREKMGRLGDAIWGARIERSADTSGARRGKETG